MAAALAPSADSDCNDIFSDSGVAFLATALRQGRPQSVRGDVPSLQVVHHFSTFHVPCRTPVLANAELELANRTYHRNWDGCAE
jgi:hypothetical protein